MSPGSLVSTVSLVSQMIPVNLVSLVSVASPRVRVSLITGLDWNPKICFYAQRYAIKN